MSKPIRQFNKKGIVLSIWKNKGLNITLSRIYLQGSKPTYTTNFRTFDLSVIKSLVNEAIEDLKDNPIEKTII